MRLVLVAAALGALAPAARAQSIPQMGASSRLVSADATFVDPVFATPVHDFASFGSIVDGPFDEAVAAHAANAGSASYADAEQFSDVDSALAAFDAYGAASAGLYVQGSGDSTSTSRFEVEVELAHDGRLVLDGDLSTTEAFGGFVSHDRPGIASVDVRLVDAVTGVVHFAAQTLHGAPGVVLDGTVIDIGPGTYRFEVAAVAADATNGSEQIDGSNVAGVFDLQGRFEQDAPTTAHVAAIELDALASGDKLAAVARVRIVDSAGRPVAGAVVGGRFVGDLGGAVRAVTDDSGEARFVRTGPAPAGAPRLGFAVTGLAHATLAWDPASNVESFETL